MRRPPGMTELKAQAISVANRHIIERPRLTRLLDETTARVIMLVAPAGYGKTVLAHQWLNSRPHAFCRVSESGDNVGGLGVELHSAARGLIPEIGDRFEQWLHSRRGTETADIAADLMAEDLRAWPECAWLAIDDYHLLTADAERVVERLRAIPTVRLLLTSRRRPGWCASRELLYGEVFELGAHDLAMTDDEAEGVLVGLGANAAELIALAEGWPAVIGLAAFAPNRRVDREGSLPLAIHSYIAEELYASLSAGVGTSLAQLSLISNPTHAVAKKLLTEESDRVVQEGLRVGFLTEYQPGAFAIHPLLREFLVAKLSELDPDTRGPLVEGVVRLLLENKVWENGFEVARRFELGRELDDLVSAALYDLLERGMLEVIERIVGLGREHLEDSPILDLAASELAFRQGFHERSFVLAESAAQRLTGGVLESRAYCRAGHAAYFLDDIDAAAGNFTQARTTAQGDADARKAIWGQFLAALDRESEDAVAFLAEFEDRRGSGADDLLRVQNGRLHLGMRLGSVSSGLRGAEAVAKMVHEARDPVIRASFWHVYSGALRLSARYEEALEASERTAHEVDRFDLGFAEVHVQLTRSLTHMGLSSYDEAVAALDKAAVIGKKTGDVFAQMSERINRCRLFLLLGQPADAVECTSDSWPMNVTSGLVGEFFACRALAMHRSGHGEDVERLLARVHDSTRENEATMLRECVRALVALDENPSSVPSMIAGSFQTGVSRSVLDPFVFAFKVDKRLPRLLHRTKTLRLPLRDLRPLLVGALEPAAVRPGDRYAGQSLTPRESEVLDLLAAGLTNAEIASTLFLAAPTVKVHVRNVLRKLGVRTRTEAAVYAVTRRRPGAAEPGRPPEAPREARDSPA